MKRQRNTQHVKEQDKCPPNQTKEIGNLPDKEFRIMIVKLIQNLEITYFTCIEYLLLIGTNLVLGMQWKQNKLDPLSL